MFRPNTNDVIKEGVEQVSRLELDRQAAVSWNCNGKWSRYQQG